MTLACPPRTVGEPYLGPAGALVRLPWWAGNRYDPTPTVRGGSHDLPGGGSVRDRWGLSRRWVLGWPAISGDDLNLLRVLARRPGPYRWLDPFEPNRLTANQADGSDPLRATDGFSARAQGTVSSSTAQAHDGIRSLAWDSDTAVAVGAGVNLASTLATVHPTWTAVRPSLAHSFSVWARASAAVTLQAGIGWYTSVGVAAGSDTGTAAAVGTGGWAQLTCPNKTSPAGAAYAVAFVQATTTTTGSAVTVWLDDPQLEEGAAVTSWRLGAGTPLVAVDPPAERMLRAGLYEAELTLLELSP